MFLMWSLPAPFGNHIFFFKCASAWFVVATLLRNGVNLQNLIVSPRGLPSPAKFMVCLCVLICECKRVYTQTHTDRESQWNELSRQVHGVSVCGYIYTHTSTLVLNHSGMPSHGVFVCVYVCLHQGIYAYTHLRSGLICIHTHTHTHIVFVYIGVRAYMHTHTHTHTHTLTHSLTHTHVHLYKYTH
jgi:hypothetical protein